MLSNNNNIALQFFESCVYKSLYMNIPIQMEQKGNKEEYVFTSHTCIIDTEIIMKSFPGEFKIAGD